MRRTFPFQQGEVDPVCRHLLIYPCHHFIDHAIRFNAFFFVQIKHYINTGTRCRKMFKRWPQVLHQIMKHQINVPYHLLLRMPLKNQHHCKIFENICSNSSSDTLRQLPPRWNSPCLGEGAYPPRLFNQGVSTRRAQLSVISKAVRSIDLLNHNVRTWINTD